MTRDKILLIGSAGLGVGAVGAVGAALGAMGHGICFHVTYTYTPVS